MGCPSPRRSTKARPQEQLSRSCHWLVGARHESNHNGMCSGCRGAHRREGFCHIAASAWCSRCARPRGLRDGQCRRPLAKPRRQAPSMGESSTAVCSRAGSPQRAIPTRSSAPAERRHVSSVQCRSVPARSACMKPACTPRVHETHLILRRRRRRVSKDGNEHLVGAHPSRGDYSAVIETAASRPERLAEMNRVISIGCHGLADARILRAHDSERAGCAAVRKEHGS